RCVLRRASQACRRRARAWAGLAQVWVVLPVRPLPPLTTPRRPNGRRARLPACRSARLVYGARRWRLAAATPATRQNQRSARRFYIFADANAVVAFGCRERGAGVKRYSTRAVLARRLPSRVAFCPTHPSRAAFRPMARPESKEADHRNRLTSAR